MLQDVKDYLKITWDDEDAALLSLIERGKGYLLKLTGALDFELEDLGKQLLLDYCRYARNNALEFFQQNFAQDILLLSLGKGIEEMKAEDED